MIYRPRVGQSCEPWYRKAVAIHNPYHGRLATVVVISRGPGPLNVAVRMEATGVVVIVPRGNLRELRLDWEMPLFAIAGQPES